MKWRISEWLTWRFTFKQIFTALLTDNIYIALIFTQILRKPSYNFVTLNLIILIANKSSHYLNELLHRSFHFSPCSFQRIIQTPIHSSIYLSIHPSIHPPINPLLREMYLRMPIQEFPSFDFVHTASVDSFQLVYSHRRRFHNNFTPEEKYATTLGQFPMRKVESFHVIEGDLPAVSASILSRRTKEFNR